MRRETVAKEIAQEYLRDIDPMWKAFWLHMHLVAKNLEEFSAGLATISDEVFAYHLGGEKNDFAKWTREVIGDAVLARDLQDVKTKEDAARIVAERVAELKKAAGA